MEDVPLATMEIRGMLARRHVVNELHQVTIDDIIRIRWKLVSCSMEYSTDLTALDLDTDLIS